MANQPSKGDQLKLAFSSVFDTPNGKLVLEQIERVSNARGTQYGLPLPADAVLDPLKAMHQEGMRAVYWYIVEITNAGRELIDAPE